eukprot:2552162-Karenia_brevis.AAC.1
MGMQEKVVGGKGGPSFGFVGGKGGPSFGFVDGKGGISFNAAIKGDGKTDEGDGAHFGPWRPGL